MTLQNRLQASLAGDWVDLDREAFCLACGRQGLVAFYEVAGVPTQTCVLLDSSEEAGAYPTGDVLLALCQTCGFIQNLLFDLTRVDYSKPTEESQAFSPKFTEFTSWLIDELLERYRLRGKSVFEVGCGKGDFLLALAERGIGEGLGIDPGYIPDRALQESSVVAFRREWYGPESTDITGNLVMTRHLLEHIPNGGEFLGWLRDSTGATPGAAMFTEVPDVRRVLEEGAYWDVYYEHCSYYTLGSLSRTLRNSGFDVDWLQLGFEDQYLIAGARPGPGRDVSGAAIDSPEDLAVLVESFAERAGRSLESWRQTFAEMTERRSHVVIWGGASKAVAFLASMGSPDVTVIDINPYRQGKWLPGVANEIQAPIFLVDNPPDLVIAMNPIYTGEIRVQLQQMGMTPEIRPIIS